MVPDRNYLVYFLFCFVIIDLMSIDWTKISNKYKGLWVALKDDEATVIASGKTAREALEKAKLNGVKVPVLTRVPDMIIPYVGFRS